MSLRSVHPHFSDELTPGTGRRPTAERTAIGKVTAVLGAQWGDEGKGKLVDILSADVDICARFAGGNNAGHTIVAPVGPERVKTTFAFHLLPCGASPHLLPFVLPRAWNR